MSDIVERLRTLGVADFREPDGLCKEAANEIERLRALLPPEPEPLHHPPHWEVGHVVEYIRGSEWAWNKGARGVINRLDTPARKGDQYQVFWVHPFGKDGSVDRDYSWWTTPADVVWVEENTDG